MQPIRTILFLLFLISFLLIETSQKSNYKITSIKKQLTNISISAIYTGPTNYYQSTKNPISLNILFTLQIHTYFDFSFTIRDVNNKKYQIPTEGVFHNDPNSKNTFPLQYSSICVQYNQIGDMFDFKIYRKYLNTTVFSTYDGQFVFSEYQLEINTQIYSDYNFGLGQRFNSGLKLSNGKWTIFSRGRGQIIDNGQGSQTYGYYPFYLQKQEQKCYHTVYIRSSNAMDVIKYQKNDKYYLRFILIGGIFNFRIIMGDCQLAINHIQKMMTYVGNPTIPPFWSLGFHQSRFGYENISVIENMIKGYQNNKIPLDTVWLDIDYMVDYQDFTIDQKRFAFHKLHTILQKYKIIPIIDAGIKINSVAYHQGQKKKVFVKDAKGKQFVGSVWPGQTTFVDFFHPNATQYWFDMLDVLFKKVNFSGIWLDMNQITQFCNGPCQTPTYLSQFDYSKDLPYNPGFDNIQTFTISLNCTHYGDLKQADVHIYHSLLQSAATYNYLKKKTQLPFVLTRSSTFGSNKFAFVWSGDNYADFSFLKTSIADMIISQMSGISMNGADICGFAGNTTVQLCSRWFQLGSLYPFARNHNTLRAISQQPYALGQTVLKSAQNNIKLRYSLLNHYYSLLMKSKIIIQPQFINFQTTGDFDQNVLDTQFMIGKTLISTPIVQKGATSRKIYLPSFNWYDFHTGKFYKPGYYNITNISLTDKVPLFLQQNNLVLTQNVDKVQTTRDLNNIYKIIAGFKYQGELQIQGGLSYFSAMGERPSIANLSNQTRVNQCIASHCRYQIQTFYSIYRTSSKRTMQICVETYNSGNMLQLMIIDQLYAYANGTVAHAFLKDPIQIRGNSQFFVQLVQTNQPNQFLGIVEQKIKIAIE